MPADLIIYALVAAGLVFWLRSVLGTRHGEERSRPDPFLGGEDGIKDVTSMSEELPNVPSSEDDILKLAKEPRGNYSIEGEAAAQGLIEISKADRQFDIHFFMQGSQDAFAMIVESFAEGDLETLKDLLDEKVYKAFEGAVLERQEKKHTQVTDIHAIRKAEAIDAKLDGRMATIVVRFIADESSVTKDEDGNILEGHPDKVSEMRDIWVFGRDVKSRDPSWRLMETRGGFEDDNELVPDSV